LRGRQIPLGARIVAIADAYEAMVHGRPYQPAQPHSLAADELVRLRGTQFDPELVPVFLDELERDTAGVPPLVALPHVARLEPEFVAGS
jgi:HD-GYP domain-containing protein (c-di-GMP phosphodiesterase class II)